MMNVNYTGRFYPIDDPVLEVARDVYLPRRGRQKVLVSLTDFRKEISVKSDVLLQQVEAKSQRWLAKISGDASGSSIVYQASLSVPASLKEMNHTLKEKLDVSQQDRMLAQIVELRQEFDDIAGRVSQQPESKALFREIKNDIGKLYSLQAALKAVTDSNLMIADGIMRDRVHYVSPSTLASMQKQNWKTNIADLVIIGAGPGGLSTALHA
jgi:hypothetical protein